MELKNKKCEHKFSIYHGEFREYKHEPTAIQGYNNIFVVQECEKCHEVKRNYLD